MGTKSLPGSDSSSRLGDANNVWGARITKLHHSKKSMVPWQVAAVPSSMVLNLQIVDRSYFHDGRELEYCCRCMSLSCFFCLCAVWRTSALGLQTLRTVQKAASFAKTIWTRHNHIISPSLSLYQSPESLQQHVYRSLHCPHITTTCIATDIQYLWSALRLQTPNKQHKLSRRTSKHKIKMKYINNQQLTSSYITMHQQSHQKC